mmetsp:Transcript_1368/g.2702  ORF Transcript_1368/g.2702 Transcript_1368/m.2702 type:complete len:344 (-) Transcript_1368:173-1204(-)
MSVLAATATSPRSFGTALKGAHLRFGVETLVFARACAPAEFPCVMQHWWSGGTFEGYTQTRVRYYADGRDPVSLPLGLAHGMSGDGTMQDNGPWTAGDLFGKSGAGLHEGGAHSGSGFFNTFAVPFSSRINVTVTLHGPTGGAEYFWCILRGRTAAALSLPGGMALPPAARLRTYETSVAGLAPYASLALLNSSAATGAVLSVTLAVASPRRSFAFLEGMLRASHRGNGDGRGGGGGEWLLSSGTEDYFLGTFYFDKGQYFFPLAGLTSLCPQPADGAPRPPSIGCTAAADGTVFFSAYRVHPTADPLLFDGPFAVSWRNGEPGHGGRAAAVNVSSLALVYEW